jgi:Fic family protein
MGQESKIWESIETATKLYDSLNLRDNVGYEKFYLYSIITHSTAIEGSTLTEADTELLFEEGLTAKGKPLIHHLMNEDLRNAYFFSIEKAKERQKITSDFLKELNAAVMKSTGSINQVLGGSLDSSEGECIASLIEAREKEDNTPFRLFMAEQHLKTLNEEITNYKKDRKKGTTFLF